MDSNNFIRLQQFHFTVYSIMNIITDFFIPLQLHGIWLILDFTYLVVLVAASLKTNLDRIPKHTYALQRKTYPTLPDWPTYTCSYDKFSSHLAGILVKPSEQHLSLPTCAFNFITRAFSVLIRELELVTHEFEHVTCGFVS